MSRGPMVPTSPDQKNRINRLESSEKKRPTKSASCRLFLDGFGPFWSTNRLKKSHIYSSGRGLRDFGLTFTQRTLPCIDAPSIFRFAVENSQQNAPFSARFQLLRPVFTVVFHPFRLQTTAKSGSEAGHRGLDAKIEATLSVRSFGRPASSMSIAPRASAGP